MSDKTDLDYAYEALDERPSNIEQARTFALLSIASSAAKLVELLQPPLYKPPADVEPMTAEEWTVRYGRPSSMSDEDLAGRNARHNIAEVADHD